MSEFVFKQFTVKQQQSAMKIGTDSVLLGCLAEVEHAQQILDIGTGTGLLALMCAQRSSATIDAVEIDEQAATEAQFNFNASKWNNRLNIHHQSLQNYTQTCKQLYDVIISNPPYFVKHSNFSIDDEQRSKARHDADLPLNDLAQYAYQLLKEDGSFWLILPTQEAQLFAAYARESRLFLKQQIELLPKSNKPVNRVIQQWCKQETTIVKSNFVVYELNGEPTLAYKKIAHEFYIRKQFQL
ncbi:MAG: tRNA1(Val) (adenine(37)-N6)-methyltransferase [Bacteroidia bacterium]